MSREKAVEIIRSCEATLRRLLADAAEKGQYDIVLQLNEWARNLAEMTNAEGAEAPLPPMRVSAASEPEAKPAAAKKRRKTSKRSAKKDGRKAGYPRFARQKDELVKSGWSKREREEYQHRAPFRFVEILTRRLSEVGAEGHLFTSEDLFPLRDPDDGREVPSYQAYLCLAWLRNEGLVVQQGRRGYTVPEHGQLDQLLKAKWQQLPRQRA